MTIRPVNGHLLIEPVKQEGFMASQQETYHEIGLVVACDESDSFAESIDGDQYPIPGTKVYFDSWLAKKYPKEGSHDEYYWLVKWEDIAAIEHVEPTIPE